MAIPVEFTREAIDESSDGKIPYAEFVTSGEPYRSLLKANPWMKPPKRGEALVWGDNRYYDTTVARKHPHWHCAGLARSLSAIRWSVWRGSSANQS